MKKEKFFESKFLIIAGQPKAGTTSLFDWMASHPDIRPSSTKETRFFVDKNYPLPRSFAFNGSNLFDYYKNFRTESGSIFMEATPDYLYNSTALTLSDLLPNAKLVAVIRDPIERINSAFYFFKQRGFISSKWTVDEYVSRMIDLKIVDDTPIPMRVLDHCKGSYLEKFKKQYGEKLLLIDFEDLRCDPRKVYEQICQHIQIEPLDVEDFSRSNATRAQGNSRVAKVFYWSKSRFVYFLRRCGLELLIPYFSPLNKSMEKRISVDHVEKESLSEDVIKLVNNYLASEVGVS